MIAVPLQDQREPDLSGPYSLGRTPVLCLTAAAASWDLSLGALQVVSPYESFDSVVGSFQVEFCQATGLFLCCLIASPLVFARVPCIWIISVGTRRAVVFVTVAVWLFLVTLVTITL